MMALFRDGGWSMYWVVGLGFMALAQAAYFASRPHATHEGFLKWMSRALLWAILTGICSDIGTVMSVGAQVMSATHQKMLDEGLSGQVSGQLADSETRTRIICQGISESLSPGIVGFAFLTVVAMLTAVGRRRLDAKHS
jgi:hypothetical protein